MSSGVVFTPGVRDSLYDIGRDAAGLKFETYPIWHRASNSTLTSGTVYGVLVGLRAGQVITTMCTQLHTAATSSTLVKMGLYDTSGNRLAVTADMSTAFNSGTGQRTGDLTSPYTVPTTGGYYAVILAVAATGPQLWRCDATANFSAWNGASHRTVTETGQTDLDATCTFSVAALPVWLGGY